MDVHSPRGVPTSQERTWSHTALAALSALLSPRACGQGGCVGASGRAGGWGYGGGRAQRAGQPARLRHADVGAGGRVSARGRVNRERQEAHSAGGHSHVRGRGYPSHSLIGPALSSVPRLGPS
jgi:hypothetical protein